jgi:predicted transcriptional regulator
MMKKPKIQNRDWFGDLSETQKRSIEAGLADLKAGRRKSHVEVMKKYEIK